MSQQILRELILCHFPDLSWLEVGRMFASNAKINSSTPVAGTRSRLRSRRSSAAAKRSPSSKLCQQTSNLHIQAGSSAVADITNTVETKPKVGLRSA